MEKDGACYSKKVQFALRTAVSVVVKDGSVFMYIISLHR